MAILKVKKQRNNIIVDDFDEVRRNSLSFFVRINFITFFMII